MTSVFFTNCNYSGKTVTKGIGRYDMKQMGFPNDSLSSIKVPPGYRVILFQHSGFSGKRVVITEDEPCLANRHDNGIKWNDQTSSFIVEAVPIPNPPPAVSTSQPSVFTPPPAPAVPTTADIPKSALNGTPLYMIPLPNPQSQTEFVANPPQTTTQINQTPPCAESNLQGLYGCWKNFIPDPSQSQKDNFSNYSNKVEGFSHELRNSSFGFVKFDISPTAIPSEENGVHVIDENNVAPRQMQQLDNHFHTFETCKLNAALANKPYFSLVKPIQPRHNKPKIPANEYYCFASNAAPTTIATSNANTYATIWDFIVPNATITKIHMDNLGILIASTHDTKTHAISTVSKSFNSTTCFVYQKKTNNCKFTLVLNNDGNLLIHYTYLNKNGDTKHPRTTIWNLHKKHPHVLREKQHINKSINYDVATNWFNEHKTYGDQMTVGDELYKGSEKIPCLVSPNGAFKLEINNGKLVLKCMISAIPSVGNYSVTYKRPPYVYKVNKSIIDPKLNKIYYATHIEGKKKIRHIPRDSKILDYSNPTYTEFNKNTYYPDYSLFKTNEHINAHKCKEKCTNDKNCSHIFTYRNKHGNNCLIGTSTPKFLPIQPYRHNYPHMSKMRNVKLQMKSPRIKLSAGYNKDNINTEMKHISDINGYQMYSNSYKIVDKPMNAPKQVGLSGEPSFTKITREMNKYLYGSSANKEGFDNHNYKTVLPECDDMQSSVGCLPSIKNNKIQPLKQIIADYSVKIDKLNANESDISSNIVTYNGIYSNVNENKKYDFNQDVFNYNDKIVSQADQMKNDINTLAFEQNKLYIASSILAGTLLIGGIYLGRQ